MNKFINLNIFLLLPVNVLRGILDIPDFFVLATNIFIISVFFIEQIIVNKLFHQNGLIYFILFVSLPFSNEILSFLYTFIYSLLIISISSIDLSSLTKSLKKL